MEQHCVLFDDTIFQNIAIVKQKSENVTVEEVKEAAQFALLQQMINDMPDGFNTMVGSKGNAMSGGQRQRLALARARLRNTPVLILDESTSALDYITRSLLLDAIRVWRRGKTTIVITHDVSQILPEDYVYVIEKSQVVQEGYRKSMQSNTGSPFETFLSSQVDGVAEVDESQDNPPNNLLSLYADPKGSSDSWDATSRHPPSPLDPLDMYLKEREELDLPTRCTVFSVYLGTPSQRNSIVPHVASPYQEQGIGSPIEATPEVMLRYGKTAARSQLSSPNVRRPRPLSFIHSSDYSTELRTKNRSRRKRKKQKPEAVVALPMTAILSTVWPKLDWMSQILLVVAVLQHASMPVPHLCSHLSFPSSCPHLFYQQINVWH